MSVANHPPPGMTVAEFLAWNLGDHSKHELVDGVVVAMAPAGPRHGTIQARAAYLLTAYLDSHHPDCRVVIEPGIQPRVWANVNVRVPDLGITCAPIEPDDELLREPAVLVEILSASNAAGTWANVWAYTTIPTVMEILVLHAAERGAELLSRQPDGSWPENPTALAAADVVTLDSIGFAAPLAAFYR